MQLLRLASLMSLADNITVIAYLSKLKTKR